LSLAINPSGSEINRLQDFLNLRSRRSPRSSDACRMACTRRKGWRSPPVLGSAPNWVFEVFRCCSGGVGTTKTQTYL